MRLNRSIYLKNYVLGESLAEDHFDVREEQLPPLRDGEVLLETCCLSVDPYMRGCMTGLRTFYVPQFDLDEPIHSVGVARVLESRLAPYEPGQVVVGSIDWSDRSVMDVAKLQRRVVGGGVLRPVDDSRGQLTHHLGVLGINGVTAFFGIVGVARPRRGETFLISSAAGGVGSVAGQIAKILGARVIGLTSTPEKRDVLVEKLGLDFALDYRSPGLSEELQAIAPDGPDAYFDCVGGVVSQTVMAGMSLGARVIECGQISTYDDDDGGWKVDIRPIHQNGLRFQSFTPGHFAEFYPAALAQLSHWVDTGKVVVLETQRHGLEAAPVALVDQMHRGNVGKMVVTVAQGLEN
jgi:NADPH-dependent curcumin reductase CurA